MRSNGFFRIETFTNVARWVINTGKAGIRNFFANAGTPYGVVRYKEEARELAQKLHTKG